MNLNFKKYLILLLLSFLSNLIQAQVYGEEIISFDFSNGIPSDWENTSESGIAEWEYRGPETTPDNTVASRGSCSSSSQVINSSSSDNGFVIFDSNYWDDEVGPCGNAGSGLAPGPHNAELITAPINLSGETSMVLTFQQHFKNFDCMTEVSLSNDGGETYIPIITNTDQAGFTSNIVEFASVNISSLAANQSDVRIKFSFSGFYYYWMIDDIVIYTPNDDDLFLTDAKYTAYDGNQGETGIEKMEYSIYSKEMVDPFQFHADVLNIGNNTQTGITLNTTIRNENDEILSTLSSDPEQLGPGIDIRINTEEWVPSPLNTGEYRVEFEISQNEQDQDLINNSSENTFQISDYIMARDRSVMVGQFNPAVQFEESHFILGNYFESIVDSTLQCTSITVAFSAESEVGSTVKGVINNFLRDSVIAETEEYTINAWDLNELGEQKFVTLQLTDPYILQDTLFLASVESFQEDGLVRVATSGESPAQTSIISYPSDNAVFYTLSTPMVRINLFPLDVTPGCTNISAINYNPEADTDDGSCRIAGCTEEGHPEYNPEANFDDGSCQTIGCDDETADNYNPDAEIIDNETCIYLGCTDENALNYDPSANQDDGSCLFDQAVFSLNELTGCAPFDLLITNQTNLTETGTCVFNFGDGTVINDCDLEEFIHTYDESGEYEVSYTYTIDGFESTFSETVTVIELPETPVLVYNSDVNQISCSTCENENTYNWILDGETVLEDAPFDIINPEDGTYVLELDNGSNCTTESEPLVVVSVNESASSEFIIYPNPTADFIYVKTAKGDFKFALTDIHGKVIASGRFIGAGAHRINLQQFSAGTYFLSSDTFQGIKEVIIKQ